MSDIVFKPTEAPRVEGLDPRLQSQVKQMIEHSLDELLESEWFVQLVDDRIRMVVEIINEEEE